jgi:tetratricopeptide (TPR) repeat protein
MSQNSHISDERPPLEELSGALRQAVEQIRSEPIPPEAVARATDRARQLAGPAPRYPRLKWAAFLAVAIPAAAAVLIAWLWPEQRPESQRKAVSQLDDSKSLFGRPPQEGYFSLNGKKTRPLATTNEDENEGKDANAKESPASSSATGRPHGSTGIADPEKAPVPEEAYERAKGKERKDKKPRPTGPGIASPARALTSGKHAPDQVREMKERESDEKAGSKGEGRYSDRGEQKTSPRRVVEDADGSVSGVPVGGEGEGVRKPMQDGRIATKDGTGRLDKKRISDLAGGWGQMSAEKREKALKELSTGLSQEQRKVVVTYLEVGDADPKAKEKLSQELAKVLKDLDSQKAGKDDKTKRQTWHLERGQPTFARVYLGNGSSLDLVSLQVTVTIEGGRARTLVDHIFHNPHGRQLEGTFEYPLPTGASPSYFAMFLGQTRDTVPPRFGNGGNAPRLQDEALARLTPEQLVKQVNTRDWGTLQEARLVNKQKALESYEEVVRGRVDPALLEYAAGNTFRGRVFPIPAKGYNRILIAYEELLPFAEDRVFYRFPLPDRKLNEMRFTLQASAADCKEATLHLKDKKGIEEKKDGSRLVFSRTWSNEKPEDGLAFTFTPARADIQAISGRQDENSPVFLYARIRPELKKVANGKPFASHAVFLLDTSQSEYPGRFDTSIKLLRKILEADADIKNFNILTFNVAGAWVESGGWLDNTTAGRKKALARLDGIVLEGATDMSAALDMLARPSFDISSKTPVNVFVLSDGQITWGEQNAASLAARFESRCPFPTQFNCYRTGLGAENLELYQALIRRGGGIFNCFTEAMMNDAARAHRRECLHVERVRLVGGPLASDILVAGRQAAVYPGGELIVAARTKTAGKTTVLVEGTFQGQKFAQEYPVEIKAVHELAPRGWAEIAVASLLALNDPKLDGLVTAYCQRFGIASRVASFLVLENDNDYKRFNLEQERGKTVAGDLARFLDDAWKNMGQIVSSRETFERFLAQVDPRVNLLSGPNGKHVRDMLALLGDKDFELPEASLRGAILHKGDADADYLAARDKDRRNASIYLAESRRRLDAGDVDGAIRVLSSVIEEFPARGDALRLVGYRLLDLKQAAQAVRLFQQVQKQRPFEPHSYRDLARSLEESGRYALAAIQYEVLLAGTWHNRFGNSLQQVGQEEYARMMQEAIRSRTLSKKLADHFGERLEHMSSAQTRADLRVTISWNTDATDVDLWVIEPDGTKCYYQKTRTPSGGQLSQDQTQGYGPERYQIEKAQPGVYTVVVHYYRPNQNLLAGETHVNVVVTRNAGTKDETVERKTVILKKHNQEVEVFKVKF